MLRVDVVLCPGGDQGNTRILERVYIWNVSDLADVSDYEVMRFSGDYTNGTGRVTEHNRLTEPVLSLVRKGLEALERSGG